MKPSSSAIATGVGHTTQGETASMAGSNQSPGDEVSTKKSVPITTQAAPPSPARPWAVTKASAIMSPTPATMSSTAPTLTGMTRMARKARKRQKPPARPGRIAPGW